MKFIRINILAFIIFCVVIFPKAQNINTNGQEINTITTAVPFLLISPDSRSGAMGDVGVAIKPDVNSIYWNPAKLSFIEEER